MQFPNPIVDRLIIYGSDGNPDVTIGPGPEIIFYEGTAEIISIDATNGITIHGVDEDDYIKIDVTNGAPFQDYARDGLIWRVQALSDSNFGERLSLGLTTAGSPSVSLMETFDVVRIGSNSNPSRGMYVSVTNGYAYSGMLQAPAGVILSEWVDMTVNSGAGVAGNEPQVKILPDGTCIGRGVVTGHSVVANALICTVDATQFPNRALRFLAACEGTGTENILFLNTVGEIRIARGSSTSSWFTNLHYSKI